MHKCRKHASDLFVKKMSVKAHQLPTNSLISSCLLRKKIFCTFADVKVSLTETPTAAGKGHKSNITYFLSVWQKVKAVVLVR